MKNKNTTQNKLRNFDVSVNLKIAALWTSFMFLYIYIDYFHLYMPATLNNMLAGKVFTFQITQAFLFTAFVSVTIPGLMIPLAVALPARENRMTNIVVATIYIPYSLFNLVGEAWTHMVFGAIVEVTLLCFIIFYAWKWPRHKEQVEF